MDDFMKVLRGWRQEDPNRVLQVLQRIAGIKQFKGTDLDGLVSCIVDFHK